MEPTLVVQLAREGKMTMEEALKTHGRNVIARCLGSIPDVEIYATSASMQPGDILVLCTDGLHTVVSEEEIRATVTMYSPEESARRLIARANDNGGPDNITAVVVKVA